MRVLTLVLLLAVAGCAQPSTDWAKLSQQVGTTINGK